MPMIDTGVPFTVTFNNIQITTAATVIAQVTTVTCPILLQRIVLTSNATASQTQYLELAYMSAAASGGTSLTPYSTSAGAGTAGSTNTALSTWLGVTTTLGTVGKVYDGQWWNNFAPYEFNEKPSGLLIPPSTSVALTCLAAPAASFYSSLTAEFVELR